MVVLGIQVVLTGRDLLGGNALGLHGIDHRTRFGGVVAASPRRRCGARLHTDVNLCPIGSHACLARRRRDDIGTLHGRHGSWALLRGDWGGGNEQREQYETTHEISVAKVFAEIYTARGIECPTSASCQSPPLPDFEYEILQVAGRNA